MEKEVIKLKLLNIVANGYETGNFDEMIPYLSEDCVWESQWVIEPRVGITKLKDYYTEKGKLIKERKSFCKCEIFKCTNMPGLGILLEQEVNNEKIQTVITIKINDDNLISRIDISNSEFYYNKEIISDIRNRVIKKKVM